jgi:hypothetical protein
LILEIGHAAQSGGLTAPELHALAERFGVSEEVLLRYERARRAFNTSIFPALFEQSIIETERRMKERGEKVHHDEASTIESAVIYRWLEQTMPENEITREHDEALAALRAALDAANPPPDSDR